jgi:hypothetical protein
MFDWYWVLKRKIKEFNIYSITQGISNLIKWFPLIWKDRDFDQGYLYDMLYFKLNNMQKFFESGNTYSADAEEYGKQIKECRDLLYRIMNESTINEHWDGNNFTVSLNELSELDRHEKELFWSNICKWIDDWWD